MKPYSAYLFDGDGTLLDTAEMIYKCFVYTCKKYADLDITREQVFSNIGIPLRPQIESFLGPLSDEKADEIKKVHMEYQLSIYKDYMRLFPGVAETLSQLKNKGEKLAVVTSRRRYTLGLYLNYTGIFHFFDALITPESTVRHKPEPEPALEAAKQLQCSVTETLFVGDSTFDIECGAKAGMDTAFVAWSHINTSSMTIQPMYIIKNMTELI